MAAHSFNYTYEYVSVRTMPLSREDNTQIVRSVCVNVTAVDQADATQTLTQKMHSPLDGVYSYRDEGLPEGFILLEDVTNDKVIEWYLATVDQTELDIWFTREIYGEDELNPPPEG